MRRTIAYICLLLICFVSGAKEITILPQFAVGDTLKYRTTAQVIMYHEKDSLFSTTKLLPEIVVEDRNNDGFVIKTTNRLESFHIDCSDPESEGQLPDKIEELNDFVASVVLKIQLDADCRPDSILNMDEVKDAMLNAFVKMFAKEQGIDVENSAEWRMDTKNLMTSAINMICTPRHLIEEQFGNMPYFNFIGIPLESGKIPASMVLTDELQAMCPGLTDLKMEIRQLVNTVELNLAEEDGFYVIRLRGKEGKSEMESELLYAGGILNHGFLSVKIQSDTERLISNFIIDAID